jgi:hypothetical protein
MLLDYKGTGYYHTLGFSNSNMTSMIFFELIISLYYLGLKYRNIFLYFIGIVFTFFIFRYTKGRTFFFIEIILFPMGLFCTSNKRIKKLRPYLLVLPFVLLSLLCIIVYIVKNQKYSGIIMILNRLFSYRFLYYAESIDLLAFSNLFTGLVVPNKIIVNGVIKEIIIDQSYLHLLFSGGILTLFIFCYYYLKFQKLGNLYNNKIFIPIIISITIGGFVEAIFSYYNAISLVFWMILYRSAYAHDLQKHQTKILELPKIKVSAIRRKKYF